MPMNQRFKLFGVVLLSALCGLMLPARAQDYPNKPVRIIVPYALYAPGGSADVFGRYIAQRLQDSLGQSVVIDNRPGGGSLIGTDAVAKAAPDGYTLLLMSNTHTVNESLIPSNPFVLMRDFLPVAPIRESDLVLVARAYLPANTLAELFKAMAMEVDEFTRYMNNDITKGARIVKFSGAKPERSE
jgi:tripartite-type tricarboxylate transporter receptor subunit TctC